MEDIKISYRDLISNFTSENTACYIVWKNKVMLNDFLVYYRFSGWSHDVRFIKLYLRQWTWFDSSIYNVHNEFSFSKLWGYNFFNWFTVNVEKQRDLFIFSVHSKRVIRQKNRGEIYKKNLTINKDNSDFVQRII